MRLPLLHTTQIRRFLAPVYHARQQEATATVVLALALAQGSLLVSQKQQAAQRDPH